MEINSAIPTISLTTVALVIPAQISESGKNEIYATFPFKAAALVFRSTVNPSLRGKLQLVSINENVTERY